MLDTIGASSISELFGDVPKDISFLLAILLKRFVNVVSASPSGMANSLFNKISFGTIDKTLKQNCKQKCN
jgi:glycine cleavage system pyridoxal-binding protein P